MTTYFADEVTTDALVNDARRAEAEFLYAIEAPKDPDLFAWVEDIKDDVACADTYTARMAVKAVRPHAIVAGQTCTCGQDTVVCQVGAHLVCGDSTVWVDGLGNVCRTCL
jgi:hypothetical protein